MARLALPVLVLLAVAGGCHKQAPPPPQPAETAGAATEPAPAVATANAGKPAPAAAFTDLATDKPTTLAAFAGKPVLVNLWATWCVPCVRELPTLARLDAGGKIRVVAVSEDMEGAKVVPPFLQAHGAGLHPFHDPDNGLMTSLKEASLPVSVLYDARGREVWRVTGGLDWNGAKAQALLAQAGA